MEIVSKQLDDEEKSPNNISESGTFQQISQSGK